MPASTLAPLLFRPAIAAIVMSLAWTSPARSQDIPDGVGVADRRHPELQPVGGRVGSFFIYPELTGMLETDDNVFATQTNRQSDTTAVVRPTLKVQSIWSKHGLEGSAYYQHTEYFQNATETVDEYGGEVVGHYDFGRTTMLRLRTSARREAERRYNLSSDTATRTPLVYDQLLLAIDGTHQFGRLRIDGTGTARSLDYKDNVTRNGVTFDSRVRDSKIQTLAFKATYVNASPLNFFVGGQLERRSFGFSPGDPGFDPAIHFDRDSHGGRVEGGFSVELPERLYGSVRVGYLFQNYADPRLIDVSNLSYGANLLWNATRLTSVRIAIDRAISPVTSTRDAGLFRTRYSAVVSHELRRNIVLTGSAEYSLVEPIGPTPRSRETELGMGLQYLPNRLLSFEGGLVHRSRDSGEGRLRFSANRAIVSLRIRL